MDLSLPRQFIHRFLAAVIAAGVFAIALWLPGGAGQPRSLSALLIMVPALLLLLSAVLWLVLGSWVRTLINRIQTLQMLFRILPVGVSVLRHDRSIEDMNRSLENILGLTGEQLRTGQYLSRSYYHGDGTAFLPHEFPSARALAEQREISGVEMGVVKEDGTTVWTHVSAAPLSDGRVVAVTLDITERKRIEQELTMFRSLVDQSPDAFYIVETDSARILDANTRAERMLGYSREELLRMRILDINAEVTNESAWRAVVASLQRSDSRIWESSHRTKAGRIIPVELSVRRYVQGGRSFNIAVARDITSRKKFEQDLRIKNHAIETSITGVAISDMQGVITYVNKAYADMLGYDGPGEIVGRSVREFSESDAIAGEVLAALRERGAWTGEISGRRKDGSLVPRLMSANIVADADGRPISMLASFLDIRGRVQVERSLRESEDRLKRAQQVAHVGSWELDLVHNKLEWSDEIFRIFELDPERFDASYEAFLNIIHPEDRDAVNRAYQASVRDHAPYSIVHRLLMPDGRIKQVQEIGETLYDAGGRPLRSFGTVQDITAQKTAEERVAASLREKETLLREIHHRVKNNLQVISSLLYFQAKKMKDAAGLAALREGQDRLRSMILVHEKLYRSRDLANIDFGDYVRDLAGQMLQSYAAIRGRVTVSVDVEQALLPIEIALPCGMIVNELVTNVFKYAFPGDQNGQAMIRTRLTPGALTLVVADTGVGFPQEVDTANPQTFGLQLVRNLAQQLGGTVAFERANGTTVTVEIPVSGDRRGDR